MCLALPGRVVSIDGPTAVVERGGAVLTVSLLAVGERIAPGDFVLVHSELVLTRLADDDIDQLAKLVERGGHEPT
ncbi:MAG TPA: HypC/HybG/HupF family hydrogenase formation chaperone [Mycobacteriales bacterium]|nr:HypC/HybG/HupF family hydrogenase formation chaperone [Mycobacteriales bacterium]